MIKINGWWINMAGHLYALVSLDLWIHDMVVEQFIANDNQE